MGTMNNKIGGIDMPLSRYPSEETVDFPCTVFRICGNDMLSVLSLTCLSNLYLSLLGLLDVMPRRA